MALSDPQSVTINAVAISLPRISNGVNVGDYSSADGNVKEKFSSQYGKRTRRLARIDHKKIVSDPLVVASNVYRSMSVSLVFDTPVDGYTIAEQKQVVDGFIAQLNASSGALITKILGGEN